MSETPGGTETVSPIPHGDERPDKRPGYPPAGQAEALAAIKAQEAAEDTDPEAVLTELDGAETPAARTSRLSQFVETHFADICPPEHRDAATDRCFYFEDQYRDLFGEADLKLSADDAADPELKREIENIVAIAANDQAIAERKAETTPKAETVAANAAKIEAGKADIVAQEAKTSALHTRAERREAKEQDVDGDLATVRQLQAEFNRLKAERGTIAALQTLLEPGRLTSPEMKAKVQNAVATAQALINAIPGKSGVMTRILDQSNIDLAASSPVQVFAGVLAEADSSTELSDDEKAQIRRVLGQSEGDFQTGSDARNIARSKEQILDPKTGEVIGEKYLHDSPDTMAEPRPNLGTYMDGERMMLATKDGLITRDVTGWSGEDIGLLAEALELHSFAEGAGITGMVETIGNIHFNVLHNATFDRAKLIETRQVMSALVGMGEGYDGDVFDPREKALLMKAQMRVLSETHETLAWNNDEAGSAKIMEDMGLKTDGQPNFDVLRAFGAYMQDNMNATRPTVQAHLFELFPDRVAPPV
jgi:hypothetical protein